MESLSGGLMFQGREILLNVIMVGNSWNYIFDIMDRLLVTGTCTQNPLFTYHDCIYCMTKCCKYYFCAQHGQVIRK